MKKKIAVLTIINMFILTSFSVFVAAEEQYNSIAPDDQYSGVSIYKDGCCEGYTLCSVHVLPLISSRCYYATLIDMNGNEIRRWSITPEPAKIFSDGSIMGGTDGFYLGTVLVEAIKLTQLDWNGNVLWSFNNWDTFKGKISARQHHDYQREGNPVGYYAPDQEVVENGTTLILSHKNLINKRISFRKIYDDIIYEVDSDGNLTGFKWYASEHFEQMGFNWRMKLGLKFIPGLLLSSDWLHTNSMSLLGNNHWYCEGDERFHPENIIISSRNANFIAIISRETGDFVWKVGPDFSKNTLEGQKLGQFVGQHNAHMIPEGLPGAGNILVFDNGGASGYSIFGTPNRFRFYSRVIEFNPVNLDIVWEYKNRFGLWPYPREGRFHKFFSFLLSSAQRLPNGNTLITDGSLGRLIEVTKEKEIVWEYTNPTIIQLIYRAYRVPPEWVPGNPCGYDNWENIYN